MTYRSFGARGPTKPIWRGKLVSVLLTREGIRLVSEFTEAPDRHIGRYLEVDVTFDSEIIKDLKRIVDASVTEELEKDA